MGNDGDSVDRTGNEPVSHIAALGTANGINRAARITYAIGPNATPYPPSRVAGLLDARNGRPLMRR